MKTLDTLNERITLTDQGVLEIQPNWRGRKVDEDGHVFVKAEEPVRLGKREVDLLRKMLALLLLILLPGTLLSSPIYRIDRKLSVHRIWDECGTLLSDSFEMLRGTSLVERLTAVKPEVTEYTRSQYYGLTAYKLAWRERLTWTCGTCCSNYMVGDPDYPIYGSIPSGGNVGSGIFTTVDNQRHQLIQAVDFRAEYRTNDFVTQCGNATDVSTMIWWYRTNAANLPLPWFVGAWCPLEPGEVKRVKVPCPLDVIWHLMGTDRTDCCKVPCWLASWPKPADPPLITGGGDKFSFAGSPGCVYSVLASTNGIAWSTETVVEADASGSVAWGKPAFLADPPTALKLYRVELLRSGTMNETESALALKDLLEFDQQP